MHDVQQALSRNQKSPQAHVQRVRKTADSAVQLLSLQGHLQILLANAHDETRVWQLYAKTGLLLEGHETLNLIGNHKMHWNKKINKCAFCFLFLSDFVIV